MKILTFDIEEWFLQKTYFGDHVEKYVEYDKYLDSILDTLEGQSLKGTFFCVGGMGKEFPEVVRKIESKGHEIGCHSYRHTWLNKMSKEEAFEDTRMAVDLLEQCIGKKVRSYRAPAFSITNSNKWLFEILSECGISRDASVFPATRDFGGFPQFGSKVPTIVCSTNSQIKEFPICTIRFMGKELAYSGGGYFRFLPLWYVKNKMQKSEYSMTYFHISDLLPEGSGVMSEEGFESYFKEPGSFKNRYLRYVKTNIGKKGAFNKLMKLIKTEDFVNLEQADAMIDWERAPSVLL